MNEYYYTYTKLRQEFGRPVCFTLTEPRTLGMIEPNCAQMDQLIPQNPRNFGGDTIIELSEHTVNTGSVSVSGRGMRHVEGGWPKDVDPSDAQEVSKWTKRAERDPSFLQSVKQLTADCTRVVQQNLVVDLFQDYFSGAEIPRGNERLFAKSIALLKDCAGEFKSQPNEPLSELTSPSPAVSLAFNAKISDLLIGGCYNGVVCLWDLRKGLKPLEISSVGSSHYDPVYEVAWTQNKTNSEFVSASTDGRVLWWDCRSLKEPIDECRLLQSSHSSPTALPQAAQGCNLLTEPAEGQLFGGVSLAWSLEAGPTKFLIGTEQGVVLGIKTRPKKTPEINQRYGFEGGRHYGPVRSVRRNPFHSKYFLSVGDWTAKVWMEEVKTPLITTPHHRAALTDGQWSPSRPGLFMVTRTDGFLSFWDYYYKQNEVAFQHKVGSAALTCLSVHSHGALVAVGDVDGRVTILGLCEGLYTPAANEKVDVGASLEREARREKNIEMAKRQTEVKRQEERQPSHIRNAGANSATECARFAFFKAIQHSEDQPKAERLKGNVTCCKGY
ncbi:hypothetical protein Esti_005395 [Eimeria stiedai]